MAAASQHSGSGNISIYQLHTSRKKTVMLVAAAVASLLVPFCDTIYLPALRQIEVDLNTHAGMTAASVAIYMFAVGIGSLVWGPAADRFGRRAAYAASLLAFLAFTLGCVFAPTIEALVALRALQGLAVPGLLTTGAGVIADIYAPEVRGMAQGLFSIPLLVGPILGPLLGGALSQAFGWRSTFICLAFLAAVVIAPVLFLLVPETHQHRTMLRLHKSNPDLARSVSEGDLILAQAPTFEAPWVPLRYLAELDILPFGLVTMASFGTMFASLTEWPAFMAAPPYGLSEAMIGVSYLAMGIAGLIGSPVGGRLSDVAATRWPSAPAMRMLPSVLAVLLLMPVGALIFGWTLQHGAHIVGPLAGHFVIGVASAAYLPGVLGYVSTIKQANAAAAAAAIQASMFFSAGVFIVVSVYATQGPGIGPWFTLLGGVQLLLAAAAAAYIWRQLARARRAAAAAAQADEAAVAVELGQAKAPAS